MDRQGGDITLGGIHRRQIAAPGVRVPEFGSESLHAEAHWEEHFLVGLVGDEIDLGLAIAPMDIANIRIFAGEVRRHAENFRHGHAPLDAARTVSVGGDRFAITIAPDFLGNGLKLLVTFPVVLQARRQAGLRSHHGCSGFHQIANHLDGVQRHAVLVRKDEHAIGHPARQGEATVSHLHLLEDLGVEDIEIVAGGKLGLELVEVETDRRILAIVVARVGHEYALLEEEL